MIIASISIISKNRQKNSAEINKVLTDFSYLISARLGVNVQKKCTKNCKAIILLALEGKKTEIKKLVLNLRKIKEISLKLNILDEAN